MSFSQVSEADLVVTLASLKVEHSSMRSSALDASADQHDNTASMSALVNEHKPENTEATSPALSEGQPHDNLKPAIEAGALAGRPAGFHMSNSQDTQSVFSNPSSPNSFSKTQSAAALKSGVSKDPGTHGLLNPSDQGDGDDKDQTPTELAEPTNADVAKATQPDDTPDEQEEPNEGSIAPPPSPATPARNTKGTKTSTNFDEFFKIQPSSLGGLGAFAARDLKHGEIILVEKPLLSTTHFRLMLDYYDLPDDAKQAYLSLHGAEDADRFSRIERIKQLNSFAIPHGIAIFALASRFNHACPPARNVSYAFDAERGVISFRVCAAAGVPAGEELFISYGGTPVELYSTYGFRCGCGGCTPLTDGDLRKMVEIEFGGASGERE